MTCKTSRHGTESVTSQKGIAFLRGGTRVVVLMRPTSIPSKIKVFAAFHHEYKEINYCSIFTTISFYIACVRLFSIWKRVPGSRLLAFSLLEHPLPVVRVAQPINVGVFRTIEFGRF
jgi:hypothetical protein